jgi:hypothetical protein
MTARNVAIVVGVGLLLVRLSFTFLVPNGSAPDEPSHFVKAFGAARLDFGTRDHLDSHPSSEMERLNDSLATDIDFGNHPLNPTWTCNAFVATRPATCLNLSASKVPTRAVQTGFGTYQPYLYIVLGAPSLVLRDPDRSLLGMRLVVVAWTSALTCLGLIIASRRYGNRGILASLVGFTPMLIYTQATLGTSGIESAAAYAMLLSGIDVLIGGDRATRGSRALFIVSAVSLAVSRPLSVYILVVVLVLCALVVGPRRSWRRVRDLPRSYVIAAGALGLAGVLANLGWSVASPAIYTGHDPGLRYIVGHFLSDTIPGLWQSVIGVLEWLDTDLPFVAILVAWSALVAVLAWSARDRDRWASMRLWLLIAATIALGFVTDYTVFARVGGAVQGRHVLPLFQFWALIAIVPNGGRSISDVDGRRVTPLRAAAVVGAGLNLVAWWSVARREAVGIHGGVNLFKAGAWSPVLGWALPIALLLIGTVLSTGLALRAGWPKRSLDLRRSTTTAVEDQTPLDPAAPLR